MPDQTDTPTTKRMTTAEVAALAQAIDGRVDDLAAVVTDVATQVQDRAVAHGELRDEIMGRLSGVRPGAAPDRDQVDARIHEALQPLHDEVHELRQRGTLTPESQQSLHGILARLEDAERKVAAVEPGALTQQVAQELHPAVAELRRRLAAVEENAKAFEGDPVSHTLAEDALADQVEGQVRRLLEPATADIARLVNQAFERLEKVEAWAQEHPQPLPDTVAGVRAALQVSTPSAGLGAARKVLQLMRLVTHIGKERQADMGTGGKFRFRGIDEAMDAVGHAMREVGLILSPEVLKDETTTTPVTKKGDGRNGPYESTILWTTTKLTMRYTFLDPEDGSTHPIEMVGEGRDASDKSTSKAGSMAFKYALLQALCIPVTGLDDSDAAPPQIMENERDRPPRPPAQPQGGAASQPPSNTDQRTDDQAKAKRAGEALQAIRNVHRVSGGPQAQRARLVEIMNRVRAENLLAFSIEGSTLNQHGQAALATIQPSPPPEEPPADEGGY